MGYGIRGKERHVGHSDPPDGWEDSTEYVLSPDDVDVAASVQRNLSAIVLELELPGGRVEQRRIPLSDLSAEIK